MRLSTINTRNSRIVWSLLQNNIYYSYKNIWQKVKMPITSFLKQITFISNMSYKLSFLVLSKKKTRLFSLNTFFYIFYFFNKLQSNENPLKIGFYIFVDLVGLGFRITKITENLYFFDLGWANGVYFFIPKGIKMFSSTKKRKILLFGCEYTKVMNTVSSLLFLRKMSPYRVGGFMPFKSIIRLRTGKQR